MLCHIDRSSTSDSQLTSVMISLDGIEELVKIQDKVHRQYCGTISELQIFGCESHTHESLQIISIFIDTQMHLYLSKAISNSIPLVEIPPP